MRAGDILGGKYVLEQLLGKGGMGVVWAAYDMQMQQKVAVKLIIPQNEEALTEELRKRLLREAGACAKLEHPNIIRVYDVGETNDGDAYMVLELLEGQALGDLLKQKRRLEPKLAARIAADVASGLSEAHAAKVVHRDLKPANIYLHREPGMAEDEFVTKVLDFGVCVDRGAMDTLKTQTGIIVGSPAYMSPEQVAMRKDIDGRTDIWSLGLMLYEMVTGTRAFHGTVQNVTAQILTQTVPAPSSKVRDVPPDLDAVVARCTQGKRENRYAEAGELARDLYVIAGVKAPVRQRLTTGPSVARQLDLVSMLDAEIQASPAVPEAGQERAFNPMGATLPLIPRDRRVATEVLPPVLDEEDDLVATRPFQPQMLAPVRSAAASKPADEQQEGALGTQFLRVDEPIASPEPEWKREMAQALEAHRQSSVSLLAPVIDADTASQAGGTQMLSADLVMVRPDVPLRADATGTTSIAGTMSQEVRVSSVKPPADPAGMTGRRRRQTRRLMFIAAGTLAVAFSFMIAVVLIKAPDDAKLTEPAGSTTQSANVPSPPVGIASENGPPAEVPTQTAPAEAPKASASADVAPPAASVATVAPPATAAPPVVTNPPGTTTAPLTAKPPGTSAPVKPGGTAKKKVADPPKTNCTGFGVFKRCT